MHRCCSFLSIRYGKQAYLQNVIAPGSTNQSLPETNTAMQCQSTVQTQQCTTPALEVWKVGGRLQVYKP